MLCNWSHWCPASWRLPLAQLQKATRWGPDHLTRPLISGGSWFVPGSDKSLRLPILMRGRVVGDVLCPAGSTPGHAGTPGLNISTIKNQTETGLFQWTDSTDSGSACFFHRYRDRLSNFACETTIERAEMLACCQIVGIPKSETPSPPASMFTPET